MIEYLVEENRVLKEQLGKKRLRLADDQPRRLAAKGKILGRRLLAQVATIVTPHTTSRWMSGSSRKAESLHASNPTRPTSRKSKVTLSRRDRPRRGPPRLATATAMRQLLTDYARKRRTQKRGGDCERVSLDQVAAETTDQIDLLVLDKVLTDIETRSTAGSCRRARFLAGLSIEETSEVLDIAPRTVSLDW